MEMPDPDWLSALDEQYSKEGIAPHQRPWKALTEWLHRTGKSTQFGEPDVLALFDWFRDNSKAGTHEIGWIFTGALFFDSTFWPVNIPLALGSVRVNLRSSLDKMPEIVYRRLFSTNGTAREALCLFSDCLDYGIGFHGHFSKEANQSLEASLVKSADTQLRSCVSHLMEKIPNKKGIEDARMSIEMMLKAYWVHKAGKGESDIKRLSHNLLACLDCCVAANPKSELEGVRASLEDFPKVSERYKWKNLTLSEAARHYGAAQFVAATVIRELAGIDCRPSFRVVDS